MHCTALNDMGHDNQAESFSLNNVLSVTLNLTVTTASVDRKSSPGSQIID